MKKILIITFCLIAMVAIGATGYLTYTPSVNKGKVGKVSEDPIKPTIESPLISNFIGDYMGKQRSQLERCLNIINDTSEMGRLAKLGFNTKADLPADQNTVKVLLGWQYAYEALYPNQQFISFACLRDLLAKYELSLGTADAFNAPVPRFAIDSMERFEASYILGYSEVAFINNHTDPVGTSKATNGYGNIDLFYSSDEYNTFIEKYNQNNYIWTPKDFTEYILKHKDELRDSYFLVVAPASYFAGTADKNGTFGDTKPKDPLILAPVEGGYIIVTAW